MKKEVVVDYFKVLPQHLPRGTQNSSCESNSGHHNNKKEKQLWIHGFLGCWAV